MAPLPYDRYYRELEAQTAKFAEAVHNADLSQPVRTRPEWTLAQLTAHLGRAHRWAGAIVAQRATEPPPLQDLDDLQVPDSAPQRSAWLLAGASRLVKAVQRAGPQAPVWTWAGEQHAGFWVRRMTHETAVHRADAELTVGRQFALAPDLAADGISEWLGLLASPKAAAAKPSLAELRGAGETLHFHATDQGLGDQGEWLVRRTSSGVAWEHGHQKGDVAVRAPAAELLLVIMRRIPPSDPRIEVLGDQTLLDHWLARTAL